MSVHPNTLGRSFRKAVALAGLGYLAVACWFAPPDDSTYARNERAEPFVGTGRYLYVVGGGKERSNDDGPRESLSAMIGVDGRLGGWKSLGRSPREWGEKAAGAFVGGRAFVVTGGRDTTNNVSTAYVDKGEITGWAFEAKLPGAGRWDHGAAAFGEDGIVVVGNDNGAPETSVAKLGTGLHSWQDTPALVVGREHSAVIQAGRFVYAIGGETPDGEDSAVIERAVVDGSAPREWVVDALPLPRPLEEIGVATDGTNLFVLGGDSQIGFDKHVYSARLSPDDGHVVEWRTKLDAFPGGRAGISAFVDGGWLYAVGGYTREGPYNTLVALDVIVRFRIAPDGSLGDAEVAGKLASGPRCCAILGVR